MGEVRRRTVQVTVDDERGVYMISVAAELAEMHPQTLRIYESKGLISPKRSPKNTRLYSQRDVERLRRIHRMTNEEGLNLAGVETVLEMEARVEAMRDELEAMRARADQLERKLDHEVETVRDRLGTEVVPYRAYERTVKPARLAGPAGSTGPQGHTRHREPSAPRRQAGRGPVQIPVQRPPRPEREQNDQPENSEES
ncbi:MAG: helix-turn-helix transcriptional regulator [Thermoleophilia bacterium]|nr:helix-turn-helix transcriptional regulator [Thermoleophilia bacterium]